jgi:hypothetical protein
MFDPSSIAGALASLRAIVDLAKNANDGQLALRISGEIGQLQGKLLDVQQQALSLQAENQELKETIRLLNDDKVFRDSLEFEAGGLYRRTGPRGDEHYCSACLDRDGKRVRTVTGAYGPHNCNIHGYRE